MSEPQVSPTSPVLQPLDLGAEVEALRERPEYVERGQASKTLAHPAGLSLVLLVLDEDKGLPDHVAPGVVTIHGLGGRTRVDAGRQRTDLHPGDVLVLEPGLHHAVHALEESALLLTIAATR